MNYTLIGIIIVAIISYFIGRLAFTLVGHGSKGIFGNTFWGAVMIAICLSKHILLIPGFFLMFILIFKE